MSNIIANNIISNSKVLEEKGYIKNGNISEEYYKLYNNYRTLLNIFLIKTLKLNEFDDSLFNSNLMFIPVSTENMDFYQYFSSNFLKFFYLRNDLFVEKLSDADKNKILNLNEGELLNPSDEILEIIGRTYADVINSSFDGSVIMNCYGPDSNNYWVDSSSLVIGIRYDEYSDEISDDIWEDVHYKQVDFLNELIKKLNIEIQTKMQTKSSIILYNDFTINKMKK